MNLKTKIKNSKSQGILLVLLCLMLTITGILIINTSTKMTDTLSGTDMAKVAKFEYSIQQTEGTDSPLQATSAGPIDIFGTTQVDSGISSNEGKLIAPGVEGHFEFTFTNNSNTPVQSLFDDLNYIEKNSNNSNSEHPVPIIFYFNGNYYSNIYDEIIGSASSKEFKGNQFVYYFHEGDLGTIDKGIMLSGNMDAFKTALNQYSTMINNPTSKKSDEDSGNESSINVTRKATVFLNNKSSNENEKSVQISWFWPYEAQYKDGNTLEGGQLSGSGSKVYLFDEYNMNFSAGDVSVTMEPVLRTIQVDSYTTPTTADKGASEWLGGKGKFGLDTSTTTTTSSN